ncbi:hypothetical protein ABZ766_19140 [Streptomyces sp. NPDC006670]|uniref:hypothetical protein n=1 Tax=Streptomyces sp. NPDC006670 TaxID=3154476 RepID=UPI0033F92DD1
MEILENLDVLCQPHLDLTAIRMGGIALGAPADSVPRQRILEAQSSVVARYRGGDDIESEYHDPDGRRLTLDQVIDHTVRSDGFLYCADELTYKVSGGLVVGFAIYGPHLSHFAHLTSYEDLLGAFGTPDLVREEGAYGDVMGYGLYYWGARKHVNWDATGNRVSLINVGDFKGNAGPCAVEAPEGVGNE